MVDKSKNPGTVYWITGLAGAGKSTIGKKLHQRLLQNGRQSIFLDGDETRSIWPDLGYSLESRFKVSMHNARLCKLLSDQGFDIVCATISLFWKTQEWNRNHIPFYREIFLRVPIKTLQERDQKGLYSKSKDGTINNVLGVDIPAEEPKSPDLIIENTPPLTPELAVERILINALKVNSDQEKTTEKQKQ